MTTPRLVWAGPLLLLAACSSPLDCPEGTMEDEAFRRCIPTTLEGLNTLCDEGAPLSFIDEVSFRDNPAGCPWGEGDNLDESQLEVTARLELDTFSQLPAADVACGMAIDFAFGGAVDDVVYDDGFFLLYGDVVVAASHTRLVELLAEDGRFSRLWDWSVLAGETLPFNGVTPYCIGVQEGFGTCSVTEADSAGPITFDPDVEVQRELLFRARQTGNTNWTLVTFGDNDADSDCRNDPYSFSVDYSVLPGGPTDGA